jgi:hypothetical protein
MRTHRALALPASALVFALALAALAAPASAAAPAPVPTWQVGQAVGYGTNLNLGDLVNTYLLAPVRSYPSLYNITAIHTLNATGNFDLWEYDQVTAKTDSYYVLSTQGAQGIQLHIAVNVTENALPRAGTYTGTKPYGYCIFSPLPLTTGTVAVNVDVTALSTTTGSTQYQVSDLSYLRETVNASFQAKVVVSGYNLPMTQMNQTSCVETVTYDSPSFTLAVNTKDQVRALFSPAWDYFDFPMSDNETWWANSTATVGATLSGTIDVQGLSHADETGFFDNLTKAFQGAGLAVQGLNSFPIDLAKITITAGLNNLVQNGVVQDYRLPIASHYRATASAMTLSDGNQYPVYLITDASYECPPSGTSLTLPVSYAAVYAPDFPAQGAGMIVGYQLLVCAGTMNVPGFTLTNTKPADAQQKIGQTETTYNPLPPAQSNAIADFFLQTPYWGLLVLLVAVAAVAALLVMRRRRRPAMAPPAAPAIPPPPPPPPGGPGMP